MAIAMGTLARPMAIVTAPTMSVLRMAPPSIDGLPPYWPPAFSVNPLLT
jgi:hypothetical protein